MSINIRPSFVFFFFNGCWHTSVLLYVRCLILGVQRTRLSLNDSRKMSFTFLFVLLDVIREFHFIFRIPVRSCDFFFFSHHGFVTSLKKPSTCLQCLCLVMWANYSPDQLDLSVDSAAASLVSFHWTVHQRINFTPLTLGQMCFWIPSCWVVIILIPLNGNSCMLNLNKFSERNL